MPLSSNDTFTFPGKNNAGTWRKRWSTVMVIPYVCVSSTSGMTNAANKNTQVAITSSVLTSNNLTSTVYAIQDGTVYSGKVSVSSGSFENTNGTDLVISCQKVCSYVAVLLLGYGLAEKGVYTQPPE